MATTAKLPGTSMTIASTLSTAAFAAKWRDNARRERASSQEHFIDLCRMLGVPTPNDPPASPGYTFEAGAERLSTGSQGWADVWKRGCFGWEYKGAHADLAAAYKQLVDYREALENPPLLVVSDMDRIEVNPYARELAGVSIWIGHIQWMMDHGSGFPRDPVLEPLDNIELRDAILSYDEEGTPVPATWPEAEFVVGNPPFPGTKLMRLSLGDEYVDDLFAAWQGAVARESDLACYWHELARRRITDGATGRAGLLATNSIRGGANRSTLDRVRESGDIFMAWSDEPWVVEGAAVRVSIVAQDDGSETERALDGSRVETINSNLTSGVDLIEARVLAENQALSFMGDTKGGAFDIPGDVAGEMLRQPTNVNGRSNADVVVPWVNGMDVTRRSRGMFIVDFGVDMAEPAAAAYEAPFQYVLEQVEPIRSKNRRKAYRERWWLHVEPRPAMRDALAPMRRFIVTPRVAKHRLFVWFSAPTLPDSATIAIARTTTRSGCSTRGRMSGGPCAWGRGSASATTRATRPPRRSRPSPSRGPSTPPTRR